MTEKQISWPPWVMIGLFLAFFVYSATLYREEHHSGQDLPKAALRGQRVWQSSNCQACHQVYGLGGYLGPDITNVTGRRSGQEIMALIESGTEVMPAFSLKPAEKADLLKYLEALDQSGRAAPSLFKKYWYGNIAQPVQTIR